MKIRSTNALKKMGMCFDKTHLNVKFKTFWGRKEKNLYSLMKIKDFKWLQVLNVTFDMFFLFI